MGIICLIGPPRLLSFFFFQFWGAPSVFRQMFFLDSFLFPVGSGDDSPLRLPRGFNRRELERIQTLSLWHQPAESCSTELIGQQEIQQSATLQKYLLGMKIPRSNLVDSLNQSVKV